MAVEPDTKRERERERERESFYIVGLTAVMAPIQPLKKLNGVMLVIMN